MTDVQKYQRLVAIQTKAWSRRFTDVYHWSQRRSVSEWSPSGWRRVNAEQLAIIDRTNHLISRLSWDWGWERNTEDEWCAIASSSDYQATAAGVPYRGS